MPGTHQPEPRMSKLLVLLMAIAAGAVVANLYYNQPLLAAIAHDLRVSAIQVGLIPTLTQVGYGLGLLLIVPLGDLAERRRLLVTMVLLAALALALTATISSPPVLIGVSFLVGLCAPPFHLGAQAAGIFGLVGVAGACAAMISGRLADRLRPVRIVLAGLGMVLLSWIILWLGDGSLWWLAAGALLLDFGVQSTHVANQSRIFAMMPEARSRINTIYMVAFFIGGASGSYASALIWSLCGWTGVCLFGMALMVLALAVQLTLARCRTAAVRV